MRGNLLGAALVVAIVVSGKGPVGFDAGRAAQNMMLAAHNEGIGSCPNGVSDAVGMEAVLGHAEDEQVATLISFGYPGRPRDPARRSPEEWIARADRAAVRAGHRGALTSAAAAPRRRRSSGARSSPVGVDLVGAHAPQRRRVGVQRDRGLVADVRGRGGCRPR